MKIEPLEHKHRYRFRVRAVNKIGRSEPCEMLGDDILIKDPWGESQSVTFGLSWVEFALLLAAAALC